MAVYLDLMPSPQFDRSLVTYCVVNFQRIKDALVRTSGRVYITSVYSFGAYPISWAVTTPFRADVLLNMTFGGWASTVGLTGVNVGLDAAALPGAGTFLFYFNMAGVHTSWSASWTVRNLAAGNHVWDMSAGAGLLSDGNDHPTISFLFVEV